MLISWDASTFGQLAASGKVCISPESMSSDSANLPYWGVLTSEQEGCYDSTELMKALGSEMIMGFDKASRLRHRLHCDGNYCGPDRSSFIYTVDGDVTFLLRPASRDAPVLQLEVMNPSAERESLIFVNDVFVGKLAASALDETGKFADYSVPVQARHPSENWTIRISPSADPQKLGWDIVKAKLYTN